MEEKLQLLENRYQEIDTLLSQGEIFSDPAASAKLLKEQKDLSAVVEAFRAYNKAKADKEEALSMLNGPLEADFREMV